MATVVKNIPGMLRTKHCRATARGQWVQELILDCSCIRVIDLSITVSDAAVAPVNLKVYDTKSKLTSQLGNDDVTIFPTVLVAPGESVGWDIMTEWAPIEYNLIVCASSTMTTFTLIQSNILDIYVRYSTKELTYGLTGDSDMYVHGEES